MRYQLFYWPIQGRGEFARLVLEEAGAPWVDACREWKGGMMRMQEILAGKGPILPFAPPFLRAGKVWLAQSAQIASYLGEHLGLAPASEPAREAARTIMLTIADLVNEVHDTHHPIAVDDYYENQKAAAKQRAKSFRTKRLPKFMRYLEGHLERSKYLTGPRLGYADLAAFQIVEGLTYAFPKAFARQKVPKLRALHAKVAARPRIAAYLTSERRYPFSQHDIFRRYPELDG